MNATKDLRTKPEPLHRILREVYRHYLEFQDFVAHTGEHVIEHGYFVYDDDGNIIDKVSVTISFWDLHYGLKELAPRKKEAVFYNVILDMKQKDVSAIMKITMVSVGQYVENAMKQLAKRYFAEGKISYESSNGITVDPVEQSAVPELV